MGGKLIKTVRLTESEENLIKVLRDCNISPWELVWSYYDALNSKAVKLREQFQLLEGQEVLDFGK